MALLSEEQAARFLRLKQLKLDDTARECPSCSFIQKGDPATPKMLCESCNHRFCFTHNDAHPPETSCTDYEYSLRVQNKESEAWKNRYAVPCPVCKVPIQKNGGCNHMTCKRCNPPTHFCWLCGSQFLHGSSHTNSRERSRCAFMSVWRRLSLPLLVAALLIIPPLICLVAAVVAIAAANLLICLTLRLIYALAFLKRVEWRRKGFPPKWMLAVSLVPPCLLAGALGLIAAHLLIGPACVAFLFVSNEGPEGVSRKLLTAAVMIPFFTSWTMWFHPENERRRAMRLARCHNDIQLVFTVLGFMGFSIVAPGFAILECFNDVTRHRMLQLGTEHAVWLAYKVGIVQTLDP